jgi:tRNA/tmRNA/rRNA uracil-C5-methylase (TrmA/RlmC/RlmD family)
MMREVEITVEKLVHGGLGMSRLQTGQTVFAAGVLPGERALVRIVRRRKGVLRPCR